MYSFAVMLLTSYICVCSCHMAGVGGRADMVRECSYRTSRRVEELQAAIGCCTLQA
jgi:hypothetical protein